MRETQKTLAFVAAALLLMGAAFLKVPDRSGGHEAFNDQGQPFFPDFKDPFACTDLQVIDYDESTATASEFQVKFKDGRWVIPSHYDYPADAKDRLAKTASGVIGLTKDTIRSDRVDDQEEMGVIDPLDPKASSLKGRGKRVTLRDASEKVLADFIIGKEVKKDERDRSGQRYARVPGQKRIYGVNVKADLSTKFADWIETNLLKLDAGKVRKVVFDNHKVDPEAGALIKGDVITIERKDSGGPWTIQGGVPEGQELSTEKLSALTSALSDLKIVGVRPKPEGLSKDLKLASDGDVRPKTKQAFESLIRRGFYPTKDGLLSNQGQVIVSTDEGAVYTLRYGEVVLASGLELTAGSDEPAKDDKGKEKEKDEKKKPAGAAENRYLFVTAAFDPSLIARDKRDEPTGPATIPDDPFQKAPDDPKRVAEEKAAKEKADREEADHERKVADGRKRVQELTDRFADWYYVTPGDSFRSIALDRASLVRPKGTKPEGDAAAPPMPGGFPPGLPQGFQHP